jgi:hypothetical protein
MNHFQAIWKSTSSSIAVGVKIDGNFVQSLVMTDIATGWAERLAMPARNHAFDIEHVRRARAEVVPEIWTVG